MVGIDFQIDFAAHQEILRKGGLPTERVSQCKFNMFQAKRIAKEAKERKIVSAPV